MLGRMTLDITSNEYNGNIDGRNFNELYVQQQQTQMASNQAMHAYSPPFAQGKPFVMSHHNNQNNGYPPASAYGVVYSNSSAAAPPFHPLGKHRTLLQAKVMLNIHPIMDTI